LSGAGKSTIGAEFLQILSRHQNTAMVLDGDMLRAGVSAGLGFSRQDRSENIRRAAHVARIFCDYFEVVIVTTMSPFNEDRLRAREIVAPARFIEVHIDTSLEICAARDPKGLYSQAERGLIGNLTGYNDVYEAPENPDIQLKTAHVSAPDAAGILYDHFRLSIN
jgi:adenylyl-sulfate kinase